MWQLVRLHEQSGRTVNCDSVLITLMFAFNGVSDFSHWSTACRALFKLTSCLVESTIPQINPAFFHRPNYMRHNIHPAFQFFSNPLVQLLYCIFQSWFEQVDLPVIIGFKEWQVLSFDVCVDLDIIVIMVVGSTDMVDWHIIKYGGGRYLEFDQRIWEGDEIVFSRWPRSWSIIEMGTMCAAVAHWRC